MNLNSGGRIEQNKNNNEFVSVSKSDQEFQAIIGQLPLQAQRNIADFQKLPANRWFAFLPKTENFSARTGHTAAVVNNQIFLFSGVDAEGVILLISSFSNSTRPYQINFHHLI